MNRLYLILAIGLMVLAGCTGIKTSSRGVDNQAYLEFIGDPKLYEGGVDVNLNDQKTFKAEVNKEQQVPAKGNVYSINPGNILVSVSYNGKLLYKQQIFLSAQETRIIKLP
jgi:hypothetical protein